jgi:N-acetylglutamate synthase-like GNAT family acetyltransferase
MRELGEAAARAASPNESSILVESHFVLAIALTMLGDIEAFRSCVDEGFRMAEQLGGGPAAVQLMIIDTSQAAAVGDIERMRARADAARVEARRINHPSSIAGTLYPWAWANMMHDPAAAETAMDEANALYSTEEDLSQVPRPMVASLLARLRAAHGDAVGAVAALIDALVASRDLMHRGALVTTLERGIDVFVVCERPEVAAVLAGAATRGPLRDMRMIGVHERAPRRQLQEGLLAELGEERYEQCLAQGAAMSYEESLEYTLAELESVRQELEGG